MTVDTLPFDGNDPLMRRELPARLLRAKPCRRGVPSSEKPQNLQTRRPYIAPPGARN
ncbi:hypothetical protein K8353_31095 [Burkholderia contaminans]|nr:hypothetical protein [Burkholderia contaminans]